MPNTNALRTSQSLVKDGNDRRSSRNHNPGPLLMSATLPAALSGTNSPASRQQPSTGSPNGLRARRFPAGLSPTTNTNTSNNTNNTVMMHPGSPTGWMVSPTAASNVTGGGALSHKASNDSVADFFGAAGMKEAMMCGAVGADGRGVTVIYPQRLGSEESFVGGFQDAAAARAHDAERANKDLTQVRVEGFFEQNHEVLIPSDLPRSTLLYVLTASDGRDLMFKLMQYTLQLFICLLQTPSLFSPEVQPFAAKWAVRFWRNYNTIRHGRSLFKLGRGLLNFFTLQTALERLWLKHHDYLAPYVAPVEARLEHMAGLLGIRVRPRRATREIGLEGSHSTIALSPLMEAAGRSGFFPDKTAQDEAEADHPMQHDVYSHISKVERNPQMLLRGGPRPARLLPGVAGFPVEAAELDESGGGSSSIHSARPFFVREGGAAARTSAPGSLQSSFAFGTSPPTNSAAGNMLLGGLLPSPTTTVESIQSSFAIGTSPLSGPLGFPSSTSAAAAAENQPMHATTTTTHEKDEDAHSVPPRQPTSHLGTARPTPQHSTDEDEDDLMFDAANTDTKTNANTCVRGTTSKSSTPTTAVVVPPSTTQDAQDGAALKLKKPRFLGGASSSTSSSVELSSDSSPHSDPPQHASPNALAQTMPLGTDPQEAVEACEDDAEEVEAVMATRPTTTTTAAAGGVGATPVANEAASRPPLPPLAPLAPTIATTQRVRTNNSSSAPTPRGNNTNNNSSSAPTPVHEFDGSEVSLATSSIASNSESGLFQAKTELQPASDAAPSKWRRGPLHFNTFLMILLCIRSLAAGTRRFMRDAMLISSERFVRFDYVERHRVGIHRRVNRMWLIVAAIDLLLNTLRLGREGWVRYAMARQSTRCRCGCSGAEDGVDAAWRASGFIARRTTELAFPHLDLDYGAPIPSSIMYFEAADPGHMLPACERCGFLYKEVSAFASKHQPEKEKPRWLQLYDREAEEGAAAAAAAVAGGPTPTTTAVDAHGHEVVMLAAGQTRSPTTTLTAVAGTPIGLGDSFGDPSIITGSGVAATTTNGGGHVAHHRENTATAGLLTLPLLMRKVLNYVWLLRVHPNLSATLLLELRCIAELFLAYRYCYGSYESFKPDAPLAAVLHPSGAIAGMVSAAVGLVRVVQSAPV